MKQILLSLLSYLFVINYLNAEEEVNYAFSGKHFLASYLNCNSAAIENTNGLLEAMDEAVKASGATILDRTYYIFPPNGMTLVYLLSESHASIHTYPEKGACFVDLFTCGENCSAKEFDRLLREYLQPATIHARQFARSETIEEISE